MGFYEKPQPTKNLPHFSHFLFFVLGLSIGFMVGFYDLQALAFSSITASLSLPPSIQITPWSPPAPAPVVPPPPSPPPPLEAPALVVPPPPPPPPPLVAPTERLVNNHEKVAKEVNNATSILLEEQTGMRLLKHNMSDNELLRKASMMGEIEEYLPKKFVPKVAFMFLTKGPLPMAPLWELFFKNHKGLYSIYIHAHPLYKYPFSQNSVFHGRFIPSQEVEWGSITMIDAERRLLANALLDVSNQRFVLLSEACIPIFNFTTVYNYLTNSNRSFLGSFDDPGNDGRGRYNKKMWPSVNITNWRKGSQWFEVHRDLANHIVADTKYYDLFRKYCLPSRPFCYSDEHYLPTLANIKYPGLILNRSLTYTDWTRRGPHPAAFELRDVKKELIDRLRFGSNCSYNGNETHTCFLFARKLMPSALVPLMKIANTVLGF